MPLRDQEKYNIKVIGEPSEVTEIRKKILESFNGLEFVDEGHKYFLNGEELISVSVLAGRFESEFDTVEKARSYAIKNGETPEYWMDKWRFTNLKATVTGTQVHSYAESLAWLHIGHPENITEDNKGIFSRPDESLRETENKNNLDFAWEICILIGSLFPSKVGTNNKTKIKAIISTKINHIMTKLYP